MHKLIIDLSLLVILSIGAVIVLIIHNHKLSKAIHRYRFAEAIYTAQYHISPNTDGTVSVIRRAIIRNHIHDTHIRTYSDADSGYNLRCAAELHDHLTRRV